MNDLISEIDAIFHSKSLAIYGVSRKGGLGNILMQGFIDQGFPKMFIVNPRITESNVEIMGIPVFSDFLCLIFYLYFVIELRLLRSLFLR